MPPDRFSRERFSEAVKDEDGLLYLTEPEPYGFRELADTRIHKVTQGDTWWSLAALYFPEFDRPEALWWIIADFQPDPVVDPTIALQPAATIYIPSVRVVDSEILSEARRRAPSTEG